MAARTRMSKQDAQALFCQAGLDLPVEASAKPKRKKRDNEEEREQTLLFARRWEFQEQYPALKRLFATLNGVYIPPALLKQVAATGLTKGVLDIWLPIRRCDPGGAVWSGLVIDLKKKVGGRPSPEQLEWAAELVQNGYRVHFCAGCVDAWRVICCYLGIGGPVHLACDMEELSDWMSRQALLAA